LYRSSERVAAPPAILLSESWREGPVTHKRTLANLSHWPAPKVERLRRVLRDEPLVAPDAMFTVEGSVPHGRIEAVLQMIRRLTLDTIIAAKRSRERDLVLTLIIERLIQPCSKLATTRLWNTSTLADTFDVQHTDVDEVYAAHLHDDGLALYDVSSSYYEGATCPLARYGHDRDGHTGRPIILYGVLADAEGRAVAVDVYPGNTGDPRTVPDQVGICRRSLRSRASSWWGIAAC
jgi:hypothetical protein